MVQNTQPSVVDVKKIPRYQLHRNRWIKHRVHSQLNTINHTTSHLPITTNSASEDLMSSRKKSLCSSVR